MRYFLVDVGAGTMDILYADDDAGLQYKAVVRSPVQTLAETAEKTPGNLAVDGVEMGGGPITRVLQERCRTHRVVISESAAATLHHDPDRVRALGLSIVGDGEIGGWARRPDFSRLTLGDLEPARLRSVVSAFGVAFEFDVFGFCAQDHGVPPPGESHLDYRHRLFRERLDPDPQPEALLYSGSDIPATFNRLTGAARIAEGLPASETWVMDSGMAAVLGASLDESVLSSDRCMVLDVATSHTVGALTEGGRIGGFFEYHTRDVTRQRLEDLVQGLAEGRLSHERILAEGGHGAYIRDDAVRGPVDRIVATGPKRDLLRGSRLPVVFGAPLGDNMMTGTVGLLEAIRRRRGASVSGTRRG